MEREEIKESVLLFAGQFARNAAVTGLITSKVLLKRLGIPEPDGFDKRFLAEFFEDVHEENVEEIEGLIFEVLQEFLMASREKKIYRIDSVGQ